MAYENAVKLDVKQAQGMQQKTDRFKVVEGAPPVPIFILKRPEDPVYATPLTTTHFVKVDGKTKVIPSLGLIGQTSSLDDLKNQMVADGTYHNETKDMKDFLNGSSTHQSQLIDMRDHVLLIQQYQQAVTAQNGPLAGQLHAQLMDFLLKEPIKTWDYSATVYTALLDGIMNFQRQGGILVDPTFPGAARLLWVEKKKDQGKTYATFRIDWAWGYQYQIPEALFTDPNKVKTYDRIIEEKKADLVHWSPKRINEALQQLGMTVARTSAPALPPAAAPVSPVPAMAAPAVPAALVVQPLPAAVPVAPAMQPAIVVQPTVVVPVAGTTQPATNLNCFGVAPDFTSAKCQQCPQRTGCMEALTARLAKPNAAAIAPAVTPPVAAVPVPAPVQPAPAQQTTQDMVTAAINLANQNPVV